ncbi:MAG: hypothetical protein VW270_12955, partial [Candidatus Poseidoniales archaeon]
QILYTIGDYMEYYFLGLFLGFCTTAILFITFKALRDIKEIKIILKDTRPLFDKSKIKYTDGDNT